MKKVSKGLMPTLKVIKGKPASKAPGKKKKKASVTSARG